MAEHQEGRGGEAAENAVVFPDVCLTHEAETQGVMAVCLSPEATGSVAKRWGNALIESGTHGAGGEYEGVAYAYA